MRNRENGNRMARPGKDRSIERLSKLQSEIEPLKKGARFSPQFQKWSRDTEVAISFTFPDKPEYLDDFKRISYFPIVISNGTTCYEEKQAYVQGLEAAASKLESMIDEIKEYWEDDESRIAASETSFSEPETTNEIFVVHGKDDGAKETVARFLSRLELEPVILHEQASQGRTIIEKFEQYAQVRFAVVLLTPDDLCSPSDQSETARFRARQNVILELGFFVGKLGRQRTFALLKGDVEIPSDYDGILYTPLDDQGAWRMALVRELKGAGLDVDANLAL